MRRILILSSVGPLILMLGGPLGSVAGTTMTSAEWDQATLHSSPQSAGCFSMTYPSTTWESIACGNYKGPVAYATIGNNYVDDIANATGSTIGESQGSFSLTSGFSSESDTTYSTNSYSLQLNTNVFATTTSYTSGTVYGWNQFVLQNYGGGNDTVIWIEYVLINYATQHSGNCPSSEPSGFAAWSDISGSCYTFDGLMSTRQETPTRLADDYVTLEGFTDQSGNNVVKMCDYNLAKCWSQSDVDFMSLATHWNHSEFNVFGYGNLSEAVFNSGFSTAVEIHVWDDSGNSITPSCEQTSYTGETNNMGLTSGSCSSGSSYTDFAESI